jgi:hypothetical protein
VTSPASLFGFDVKKHVDQEKLRNALKGILKKAMAFRLMN